MQARRVCRNIDIIRGSDSTYHLTSAAIVLLRCTIDGTGKDVIKSCKSSLVRFMDRLRQVQEVDQWDLGDICLAQCEEPILRVTAPDHVDIGLVGESRTQDGNAVISNYDL